MAKKKLAEVDTYQFADKGEWALELESLNSLRKRTPWQMARLVLWGIEYYCVDKDEVTALYDEISEQLEVNRKTLQNYASCARRFPPDDVFERLDIGHHIVVVAQPEEIATYWLSRAESNGWSVSRLRQEIRNSGVTPSEEDEDPATERGVVLKLLAHYGIMANGDDKTLSMNFPDGKFINISANSDLHWSVT